MRVAKPEGKTSPPQSTTNSSASHLARIRENQRRSRARRKEYLQELEEKFRKCEQAGVEASHEMQQAAKRVLEENRRLRAFLRSKGIDEREIESCATANMSPSAFPSAQHTSATQNLELLLTQRRPCPVDSKSAEDSRRASFDNSITSGASPADMSYATPVAHAIPSPDYSQTSSIDNSGHPTPLMTEISLINGTSQACDSASRKNPQKLRQQQYIDGQFTTSVMPFANDFPTDTAFPSNCYYPDYPDAQVPPRVTMQQHQQRAPCSWASSVSAVPCFLQQDVMGCQGACSREHLLDTALVTPSFL